MDQLEARLSAPPPTPPRVLSVREALTMQLESARKGGKMLALADVISSGNAGILPPVWSSEVRNAVDSTRYLIPFLGSVAFPSSGYTLTFPKVLTGTTVGPRGTEKTNPPSGALTTGSDTYTAAWYAGAVDVALELVLQSDPSVAALVVEDLLVRYAIATDQAVGTALNTAATATGAALSFATYGAFVAAIMDTAEAIRGATGVPGDLLQLKTASWKSLMSLVDSQGRRILSTIGATNADGSAGLTASQVDVGGITVFHNPRATQDIQFNSKSARVAERPPVQLSSDNTALLGRDFGVLGAIIFLPLFPTGIKRHAATTAAAETASKK
jgi:hypothetical protein